MLVALLAASDVFARFDVVVGRLATRIVGSAAGGRSRVVL